MSCRGFLGTKSSIRRKLVLLGDATIIKASLLNVFTQGYFSQIYEPIIFENYVHNIQIDNKIIELALWDTTGQEEFNHLRKLSYADAHVVMLCFSVDNRDSLKNIESKWIEDIMEHCPRVKEAFEEAARLSLSAYSLEERLWLDGLCALGHCPIETVTHSLTFQLSQVNVYE
ncbi:hypothetical protein G9A89_003964 [Geosiphon pyriformis]|nr:hypothetical protein G9A89_003964 [Geosiphon pyriformis]